MSDTRSTISTESIDAVDQQDGHCVVTISTADSDVVALVVTFADLFLDRLDVDTGASPVARRVWYRQHGS